MAGLSETLIISPHKSEEFTYSALAALKEQFAGSKSICVEATVPEDTRQALCQLESSWECCAEVCRDECAQSALFSCSSDFRVLVVQSCSLQQFLLRLNPTAKSQAAFALVRTEHSSQTGTILRTFLSNRELVDYFLERPLKHSRMDLFDRSGVQLANGEVSTPLGLKIGSAGVLNLAEVNPLGAELLLRCREKAGTLPSVAVRKRDIEALRDQAVLTLRDCWEQPLNQFLEKARDGSGRLKEISDAMLYDIENYSNLLRTISDKQFPQLELIAAFARELPASLTRTAEEADKLTAETGAARDRLTQLLNVPRKKVFELQVEGRQSDMRVIVAVKRTKQYVIPCELVVATQAAPEKVLALAKANEEQQVDIGSFNEFPDAVVRVHVRNPQNGEPLSATVDLDVRSRGPLSIPRPAPVAAECALFRFIGNIEEVEMEVRASAGEAGLAAFQSVAAAWENFDSLRALDFIDICKAEARHGANVMKARLAEAGFNVR